MTIPALTKDEFQLFRNFIEESCGISLGDDKEYLVESRLASLVEESGCGRYKDLYFKAKSEARTGLRDKIVDIMTTNETLWFRDAHPFHILKEKIFRQYDEEVQNGKRRSVKIWSAACATGQEPYSIAMTTMDFAKNSNALRPQHFQILATDISPSALYIATVGNYDVFAMNRGLPEPYRDSYFDKSGRFWRVKDEVKGRVSFKKYNLQDPLLPLGKFDIIFCRNVAIYFSHDFKVDLFSRMAKILHPGGYFFLGASESMTAFSDAFEMMKHKEGVYYKIKG